MINQHRYSCAAVPRPSAVMTLRIIHAQFCEKTDPACVARSCLAGVSGQTGHRCMRKSSNNQPRSSISWQGSHDTSVTGYGTANALPTILVSRPLVAQDRLCQISLVRSSIGLRNKACFGIILPHPLDFEAYCTMSHNARPNLSGWRASGPGRPPRHLQQARRRQLRPACSSLLPYFLVIWMLHSESDLSATQAAQTHSS